MPKRKITKRPDLWQVKNFYLFPLSESQDPSLEFLTFREMFPDTKVLFLTNAVSFLQSILCELSNPSKLEEQKSDYDIVPARLMGSDEQVLTVFKHKLIWNGRRVRYLGSHICKPCFFTGKLSPQTCFQHLKCDHGKQRDRSCKACVAETLLGFWKERVECFQGNTDTLFTISRLSKVAAIFKCAECEHIFETKPFNITTKGSWCLFCAHKQLCEDAECKACFSNSFASDAKSAYWISSKNDKTPRQVFKFSNVKYCFCCNICSHSFYIGLDRIAKGRWCTFCSNKSLCDSESCQTCFLKSFASQKKSDYWHNSKNNAILPRNVFASSQKKYWFVCVCKQREV